MDATKTGEAGVEKSCARLFQGSANDDWNRLEVLFRSESQNKWAIGDELVRLKEVKGKRLKEIAVRFNQRRNRLSEIYRTTSLFPEGKRDLTIPFFRHELARMVLRKKEFQLNDPVAVLREMQLLGLNRRREAFRHYARKTRQEQDRRALDAAPLQKARQAFLVDRCHHADFRTLVGRFNDGSIKIVHADPPYGTHRRLVSGYGTEGAGRVTHDAGSMADALEVTLNVLRFWQSKLVSGGCLLLWQPAGPARIEVLQAAKDYGWSIAHELIWDKSKTQIGDPAAPYAICTEKLLVLKRQGDELLDHCLVPGIESRSDILRFEPVRQRSTAPDDTHLFQKPDDLCEFLLRKHSYQGELVVDLFGCSGSFCIAAERLHRKWVYIESHAENYKWGTERIGAFYAQLQGLAG